MKSFAYLIVVLLMPGIARAVEFSPALLMSLEGGGDNLVHVSYSDGSTSNIKAGSGFLFALGVDIDLTETIPHRFEAQLTGGLKWSTTKQAANGDADWFRFPIELISFYHNVEQNYRFGFGIDYQIWNQLSGSKDAAAVSANFDNTFGFVFAIEYIFGAEKHSSIGLRYTAIRYQPQIINPSSVDGNSWGISFTLL